MSDNVVVLPVDSRLPIPAHRVLDNTPRDMRTVIVVGYGVDGQLYVASSDSNGASLLWLLERAKECVMRNAK